MSDKRCVLGAMVLALLTGCAVSQTAKRSRAKLALLKAGDSREQVLKKLGRPTVSRPPQPRAEGGTVQLDEYRLFPKNMSRFVLFSGLPSATIAWWNIRIWEAEASPYWLKYVDSQLEKWGPAADFAAELSTSTAPVAAVAASTGPVTAVTLSTASVIVSTASVTASTAAVAGVAASTANVTEPAISTQSEKPQ